MKPKLLSVSARTMEWCTRCMSGVTTSSRTMRSIPPGMRTLPWLNIEVALSSTSKTSTASAGCRSPHHGELDEHGEHDLDGVEAHARGHVDVEVGVVHAVQPPQRRHPMEHRHAGRRSRVEREEAASAATEAARRAVEQPQPFARCIDRHADRRNRNQQPHQHGIHHDNAEIVRPSRRGGRLTAPDTAPEAPNPRATRTRRPRSAGGRRSPKSGPLPMNRPQAGQKNSGLVARPARPC